MSKTLRPDYGMHDIHDSEWNNENGFDGTYPTYKEKTLAEIEKQGELFQHGDFPPEHEERYHEYMARRLRETRIKANLDPYKYRGQVEEAILDIKDRLRILEKLYANLYPKESKD